MKNFNLNPTDFFILVVSQSEHVPKVVRVNSKNLEYINEMTVDESYIRFLDHQIEINNRGWEWRKLLTKRRAALLPFCNVPLIDGMIKVGSKRYSVYVERKSMMVVHWEEYEA